MKLNRISVKQKLEILDKLERGVSVKSLMDEYKVGQSTIYDVKYAKEKLKKLASEREVGPASDVALSRTRMCGVKYDKLDEAVYDWYREQKSTGLKCVRGTEIRGAARKFAELFEIENFQASSGWLFKFYARHDIGNKKMVGESGSADVEAVEPFKEKLKKICLDNDIESFEIYNADETGLYWKALPKNTVTSKKEKNAPGFKPSKQRISVLFCANADGSHRIKPLVVGNAKRPRALRNSMDHLPVVWRANKKAWFTQDIFKFWFDSMFCPAVRLFQTTKKGKTRQEVRAILLLDNAPAHPSVRELRSPDGRIRVEFLPANTTSLIQPMDQSVIQSFKNHYRRLMLDQVLVVELVEPGQVNTCGQRTLENYKLYNLRDVLLNVKNAWDMVKVTTLVNAWKRLITLNAAGRVVGTPELNLDEEDADFEGFQVEEMHNLLVASGSTEVTQEDVSEWLNLDSHDPGHGIRTDEEIVADVQLTHDNTAATATTSDGGSDEEEEDGPADSTGKKLSKFREALDHCINFMADTDIIQFIPYDYHLRDLRKKVIQEIQARTVVRQTKIGDYFKVPSRPPSSLDVSSEPQPGTSSTLAFGDLTPSTSTTSLYADTPSPSVEDMSPATPAPQDNPSPSIEDMRPATPAPQDTPDTTEEVIPVSPQAHSTPGKLTLPCEEGERVVE